MDIGVPNSICQHCGAALWFEERNQKDYNPSKPRFSLCCSQGRVILPQYVDPPQPLYSMFCSKDRRSRYFQSNIRSFNNMFAFTSMGGKIKKDINVGGAPPTFVMNGENYHQIGSLMPLSGDQPKFAQLYICDTENEIRNRMSVVRYLCSTNSHIL